jgi:RHS repeat-associated protein
VDQNGSFDERLYASHDANWNSTSIVSAVGSVQERYSYDAYGHCSILTATFSHRASSLFEWEVGFSGYRLEKSSGLFDVRNRLFSPLSGWIQRDESYDYPTVSLYSYCLENPINFVDPTGQITQHSVADCVDALDVCMAAAALAQLACLRKHGNQLLGSIVCRILHEQDVLICTRGYYQCLITSKEVLMCVGGAIVIVGTVIIVGTIIEDIGTAGAGILNDPATLTAGLALVVIGGVLVESSGATCKVCPNIGIV